MSDALESDREGGKDLASRHAIFQTHPVQCNLPMLISSHVNALPDRVPFHASPYAHDHDHIMPKRQCCNEVVSHNTMNPSMQCCPHNSENTTPTTPNAAPITPN